MLAINKAYWKKMEKSRRLKSLSNTRQLREGGGFLVRRPIGDSIDHCDPFLMLDHGGPKDNKPGEAIGAPD